MRWFPIAATFCLGTKMSSEKLIDYLKEDLQRLDDKVESRFDVVNEKLDTLLEFKWQIVGGSIVVSLVISVIVQVLSLYANK